MTDKSPTPDLMPKFHKACRLDQAPKGAAASGNAASIIAGARHAKNIPHGRSDPMDAPTHGHSTAANPSLGAGGGRLGDATGSIKSGAKTPKADWGALKSAAHLNPKSKN